nr:MAG TPA_asm: major tail protein [Caudoviricetes sp.]
MEDKKFGLLRGLSEIYIDEISDSAEAYTPTGKPEQLIPAGELKIKKSVDKTQVYFDNALYAEVRKENASEMEIVGAAIRAMFNAWLEGKSIDTTTGAIMDDGEAHEKYFAISGKKDYTDGTSEYFWFLKCSYGGAEESTKTKNDSTDASGMTLPFTAYKTQFKFTNGNKAAKVVRIDTSTTKIKADASWTKQVVTPDNLSEVIEKATSV